jgi:hypothetical protein
MNATHCIAESLAAPFPAECWLSIETVSAKHFDHQDEQSSGRASYQKEFSYQRDWVYSAVFFG